MKGTVSAEHCVDCKRTPISFEDPEKDPENRVPWLDNDWRGPGSEEAYRVFYGTLPPWEYDEMGCVWA